MLEVAVEGQRRAERAAEGKGGKRSGFDGKEEGPGNRVVEGQSGKHV